MCGGRVRDEAPSLLHIFSVSTSQALVVVMGQGWGTLSHPGARDLAEEGAPGRETMWKDNAGSAGAGPVCRGGTRGLAGSGCSYTVSSLGMERGEGIPARGWSRCSL